MMNALRLKSGFTVDHYQQQTHQNAYQIQAILDSLVNKKLLQRNASSYRCTEQGWNFLNDTVEHFLPSE